MNIGFDAKRAFHNYTGLGNYSRFVIEALMEYCPEHKYTLYTPKKKDNAETAIISKSKIVEVPAQFKLIKSLWRSLFLFHTIGEEKLDIYHGLSNELPAWGGRSVKKVVTIHDLIFLRFPELYPPIDRKIYTWKFSRACKRADLIIAISEQTKSDIIKYFGIAEDKIKVVYQGHHDIFNKTYSTEELNNIKDKYDLPDQYFLNVGTLEKRKNALIILKALSLIKNPLPLVIVGKPTPYMEELQEYINKNELYELVHFKHNVSFSDLPAVYQMSGLFIYPSIFEGFGIPIIEAMRSRVPVITSKGSCFSEAGGDAAYYIDHQDHQALAHYIEKIMADQELQQSMVEKGLNHLKKFTKKKIATDLNKIYNNLL